MENNPRAPVSRPILMSAPMVRAILSGQKTQTRRVMSVQPTSPSQRFGTCIEDTARKHEGMHHWIDPQNTEIKTEFFRCPYGQPGDRLWVREGFCLAYKSTWDAPKVLNPDGTGEAAYFREGWDRSNPRWRPSIHMPRWASRILLEVVDVRVERLQDITDLDVVAEGCDITDHLVDRTGITKTLGRDVFKKLWDSINGKPIMGKPLPSLGQIAYRNPRSWDANPYVWVVEFKVVPRVY